jgi:Protein kinase domain/Double sensory domain of two-component sensor kinase
MPLASGARLGPYEIVGALGAGGMGEVYRARDTRLEREVAIKVLPSETQQLPDRLARFEREARAVAALNHPNILALHDIGRHEGIVFAVMELLEGQSLRERLDAPGRLTPLKAIDYAIQILRGLAAAHERGFIHRDLKPENLFVTHEGRVKILDFGLVQEEPLPADDLDASTTRSVTSPGVILGTVGYVSPEQVLGQAATVRSDLFAFGVVVYEMLTGTHPFRRRTPADTMTAILREDPPPLARRTRGLPPGITRVFDRCLDKHADDRPGSARDLALYLEAAGVQDHEASPLSPAGTAVLRRRILAISCGLLVLLAATTWAFVRVMADRAVTAAIEADLTRAEQLVNKVQRDRLSELRLTARLVASFPELKALFATDAATIRDFLVSYQQRNPEAPLLIALDPAGRMIARTDDADPAADESVGDLLVPSEAACVVQLRGRPFHAAASTADAAGHVFGHIVAASPLGDGFAAALREATQDEIVLLSSRDVLASTLRSGQTPFRSRDEWRRAGAGIDRSADVSIGAQRFVAREVRLADRPEVSSIILKSRDEVVEPFRRIQNGVVVIGMLCAAVAAAGALWIARTLARAFKD